MVGFPAISISSILNPSSVRSSAPCGESNLLALFEGIQAEDVRLGSWYVAANAFLSCDLPKSEMPVKRWIGVCVAVSDHL